MPAAPVSTDAPGRAEVLDSRRARRLATRESSPPDVPKPAAAAKPRTRAEARSALRASESPSRADRPLLRPAQPAVRRREPAVATPAKGRRRLIIPAPSAAADPVSAPAPAPPAPPPTRTPAADIPLPTRASLRAASAKLSADLTHNRSADVTTTLPADDETSHGRRAALPHGARRRVEVGLGRAVSNRRAWGGALAIALVLMVPGASILNRPSVTVADDSGLSAAQAAQELDQATVQPTDAATAAATAKATAAAKATAKAKATAAARATAKARATAAAAAQRKKPVASRSAVRPADVVRSLAGISGARSGLPYASGLYMPGSSPANATAFGNWRGRPVDVVVDWPARQSWDDIENPDWLLSAWKNTPYTKSFGVAPIPEDGSSSLASCAAGNNNSHWRTFATNMKNSGYSNKIVIRLGWEFNGDWYVWKASNPGDFAECWRQIVSTVKPIAPNLRWDWNVNAGPGSSVTDAAKAYPGNDYVDIVGIDAYDQYPGVKSDADWAVHYSGPYGLKHWLDFAKSHGKPISVPEWGLYPTRGSNGGGDNPLYIKKMLGFFEDNASNLAYESYFNEPADYYKGAIFDPSLNPDAAAEYKSLLK